MIQECWDESALVKAAQKGNLDAFNALILHYQSRVYNLAYHILRDGAAADDAAQQTFIAAYRALAKFKAGSFKSWLLRIVTNLCYDELRRYRRHPAISWGDFGDLEEDANPHLADESASPERKIQQAELRATLERGLALLSQEQR
jgi:RNA polymerase sigma-70 factor (ECF subfamily)